MRQPPGGSESIWDGMPRGAVVAYVALGVWAAAAVPLMLTLGGWLHWNGLDEPWSGRVRLAAAAAVALAAGGLTARPAFWRNLRRERHLGVRLATLLLGLPLVAGLLWLCTWQTAEHAAALGIVAAGTPGTESGIVRQLDRQGLVRDCPHSVLVSWDGSGPLQQCISRTASDELAVGMEVRRGWWRSEAGFVRSATVQPPTGLSPRAVLAHTRQALNPLVVFLLLPASAAWAVWLRTLGKHRFIYLGIILAAWGGYFALPS